MVNAYFLLMTLWKGVADEHVRCLYGDNQGEEEAVGDEAHMDMWQWFAGNVLTLEIQRCVQIS